MGKVLGHLPGEVEEKLNPWMQPIFDIVEFRMGGTAKKKERGRSHKELIDLSIVQIEPLTDIRGRSIPSQDRIVDYTQNFSPHEVKTIRSRAGEGTKIVLTGHPYQNSNLLTHVVNRFRAEKIAAHVVLPRGERSELADVAANVPSPITVLRRNPKGGQHRAPTSSEPPSDEVLLCSRPDSLRPCRGGQPKPLALLCMIVAPRLVAHPVEGAGQQVALQALQQRARRGVGLCCGL